MFRGITCPEDRKLTFASFMLIKKVEYWWVNMQQLIEARGGVINWESFKGRFLEKYFPNSVKFERNVGFMMLLQGTMFV